MKWILQALFFLSVIQGYAAFNLTWGAPAINLDSNPPVGDTDGNPSIAIDLMGNAVATWSRTTGKGATEDVWAAIYNHSLRVWTGPVKISGGGSAANPRVGIDAVGNAWFVWDEGFPAQIVSRILTAQGVWVPDLTMPPNFVHASKNTQIYPQIAVDPQGNAVAIWMEYFKKAYHIQSARKPFGLPWVGLGQISSGLNNALLVSSKAISINEMGNAITVWQEFNGSFYEIHGAQYMKGAWLPPIAISDEGKNAQFPSAGIDAMNHAVIVWGQDNAIRSKTLIDSQLSPLSLLVSNPAHIALHPDVGVDAEGNAVVVFERYNAMHKFITGATLPFKAAVWSPSLEISGPSPSVAAAASYPILSLNAIGDGVVLWKEQTETGRVIQGAGYSLGTWSLAKALSSPNSHSGAPIPAYDIAISVNSAGSIMAVWPEDPSGTGSFQIKATAGIGLANGGPLPPLPPETPVASLPPAPPELIMPPVPPVFSEPPARPVLLLPPQIELASIQGGIVYGVQIKHRFPAHTDLINILTWTAPDGATYYKIYRGNLSNSIGTTQNTRYEDHQRIPKQREVYLVTSVDSNGQESSPITIVVNPL